MAEGFLGTLGEPDEAQVAKAREAREEAARRARTEGPGQRPEDRPRRLLERLSLIEIGLFLIIGAFTTAALSYVRYFWLYEFRAAGKVVDTYFMINTLVGYAAAFPMALLADWKGRRITALVLASLAITGVAVTPFLGLSGAYTGSVILGVGTSAFWSLTQVMVTDRSRDHRVPLYLALAAMANMALLLVAGALAQAIMKVSGDPIEQVLFGLAGVMTLALMAFATIGIAGKLLTRATPAKDGTSGQVRPSVLAVLGDFARTVRQHRPFYLWTVSALALMGGFVGFVGLDLPNTPRSGTLRATAALPSIVLTVLVAAVASRQMRVGQENATAAVAALTASAAIVAHVVLIAVEPVPYAGIIASNFTSGLYSAASFLGATALLLSVGSGVRTLVLVTGVTIAAVLSRLFAAGLGAILLPVGQDTGVMTFGIGILVCAVSAIAFRQAARHFPKRRMWSIAETFD